MIKPVALFGLTAGGFVALGQLSAAQWHAIGAALLALTLRYGLTVLPWLLMALFAWRYWRWKRSALDWIAFGKAQIAIGQSIRELEWKKQQEAVARSATAQRRKRATR
jgi:hypothetical protein